MLLGAAFLTLLLVPELAFAQATGEGSAIFCFIAKWFKQIIGAAALIAIFMWALENVFGASKLHDIVIRVGVSCAVVAVAVVMITSSGLTVNCSGL